MTTNTHSVTVHGHVYDIDVSWEEEQESYKDVYGEEPPEGYEFFFVSVADPREGVGRYASLTSLGFVDLPVSPYPRRARIAEVEAQLVAEAVEVLTTEEAPGKVGASCS